MIIIHYTISLICLVVQYKLVKCTPSLPIKYNFSIIYHIYFL